MKVVIPASVEKTLFEIALYIANDDPAAADRMADALEARCLALADHPDRGVLLATVGGLQIRRVIEGRFLILYSVSGDLVHIRKITHGARAPQSLLKGLDLT